MAEICCEVVSSENETTSSSSCDPNSRAARRRRMDIRSRYKCIPDHHVMKFPAQPLPQNDGCDDQEFSGNKKRLDVSNADRSFGGLGVKHQHDLVQSDATQRCVAADGQTMMSSGVYDECPKFGATAVCGRRREMEDAVAIHPSLCRENSSSSSRLHFFGLYDGHGCSHVAMSCKDRMHKLVKEEIENPVAVIPEQWKELMERSFSRMDKEVIQCKDDGTIPMINRSCRCELKMPQCESVGSTAVVSIVTPEKVVVANCGDSRAVLSRGGKAVPLSTDHKPDLPAELQRIQSAGGRVIYWDGPRVLGVLAMSRAIGDNYLKPYVSSEPEITVTDRTEEDEFMILASDGLWDVVSNDTACDIVRMCLLNGSGRVVLPQSSSAGVMKNVFGGGSNPDKACSDAAMLLTKLALARRSADNVSVVVVDLRKDLGSSSKLTNQKVSVAGC
ncbi:hypothetical protein C5167_000066 [Papaver somniferum]|uniref:protein-serine/threonine phosphatase n=1 Tax=Papaver somniferum TaxID=3469 RepID=A0A4Y7KVK1_PAPSO|nr:probable protein phosphatase 2C 24 [Papaver somniferum]RZC75959.1 hypothetical protein C5167_000066 [Papaver somniferum]